MKKQAIQYSRLRYENIPHKRGGRPRVWYLEEELGYKAFIKDLLNDLWKLLKRFIKLKGKKEVVIGIVFLIGFIPRFDKVQALSSPVAPLYIQPVPRLKPLEPIQVAVPEEVALIAVPEPVAAPVAAPVSTYNGSGDQYLDWIIAHESGGNPYAMNSIGACGLGQSLPCSKVLGVCGSLGNVDCQIEWVRSYCIDRYGSTYNAYLFWQQNNWY